MDVIKGAFGFKPEMPEVDRVEPLPQQVGADLTPPEAPVPPLPPLDTSTHSVFAPPTDPVIVQDRIDGQSLLDLSTLKSATAQNLAAASSRKQEATFRAQLDSIEKDIDKLRSNVEARPEPEDPRTNQNTHRSSRDYANLLEQFANRAESRASLVSDGRILRERATEARREAISQRALADLDDWSKLVGDRATVVSQYLNSMRNTKADIELHRQKIQELQDKIGALGKEKPIDEDGFYFVENKKTRPDLILENAAAHLDLVEAGEKLKNKSGLLDNLLGRTKRYRQDYENATKQLNSVSRQSEEFHQKKEKAGYELSIQEHHANLAQQEAQLKIMPDRLRLLIENQLQSDMGTALGVPPIDSEVYKKNPERYLGHLINQQSELRGLTRDISSDLSHGSDKTMAASNRNRALDRVDHVNRQLAAAAVRPSRTGPVKA